MTQHHPEFSLTGALPTNTTVLEASAGTGKTYAIAALAVRYVAQGRARIDDLLLITFSRAATAELRLRVRERLHEAAFFLEDLIQGRTHATPTDAVLISLGTGTPDQVAERAARLASAVADFDRATIMTTHEFCHSMLSGLGILAPQTPLSTLIEELGPLADEASADVYVSQFARREQGAPFPYGRRWNADPGAQEIGRRAASEDATLVGEDASGAVGDRVRFAQQVRDEVARRKHALRVYSFDDQLERLKDALNDDRFGAQARQRLSSRFPVVLVDEFQDTDPVQWSILRSAFHGSSTLVLIGDPKQAIYGFRGGDVHTYTLAVQEATTTTTLPVNYRSDPETVAGVAALFEGVLLGEGIVTPPVTAARHSRLQGRDGTAWAHGVHVRSISADTAMTQAQAAKAVGDDLVGVVAELLSDQPPLVRLPTENGIPVPGVGSPLRARDIAVLVRSNKRGATLAKELAQAGIPATFTGSRSVFSTTAADDWLTLLQALDEPRRPFLQRAYLTDFIGATVPGLAEADEAQHSAWAILLHRWARTLERSGVPALVAAFDTDHDFTARLLQRPDGEQRVTDHRQIAELLHRHRGSGVTRRPRDLAAWLHGQRAAQSLGGEATRRRATDADAVTVMTIHRAKGLQWPVVLLPESGEEFPVQPDHGEPLVLPGGTARSLDIGGRRGPDRARRWEQHLLEDGDESLRAFYVGLTRAESRVVTWWAPQPRVTASPLHRLVHADHDPQHPRRPLSSYPLSEVLADSTPLGAGWLPAAGIGVVEVQGIRAVPLPRPPSPELTVRSWDRTIDQTWRRTSYSGLTAAAHDQASPVDSLLLDDEGGPEDLLVPVEDAYADLSPMATLPAGAAFGTLVHAVYEATDATVPSWRDAVADATRTALRRVPVADVSADALATALAPSFDTPLGPLFPGRTLRDFSPADRLAEMDFEFALSNPSATVADLAHLLERHLPPGDPLAAYPARLANPLLAGQRLHGFLTGSIDAVLRDGDGAAARFVVVDYKTNWLAPADEPLTIGHYTRAAMAEAMMASHYPLQALLYSVALHRFLATRWRPYEPERHLGGVAYLFVRGMAGEHTPQPDGHPLGVFTWKPSADLVLATSALLAGEETPS